MMHVQSKPKQTFLNKRVGVIVWILSWPFVSLLFDSNPHYPAFLTPIAFLSNPQKFLMVDCWDCLFFEEFVFPAVVFWLVLIGAMVFLPSKK